MTRLAIIALLLAAPAHADGLNLSGTTVTIVPPTDPAAMAEIRYWNSPNNNKHDNGVYTVTGQGITAQVEFIWDHDWTADKITVTPPDGYACRPVDCELSLTESTGGTIWLYSLDGVGM